MAGVRIELEVQDSIYDFGWVTDERKLDNYKRRARDLDVALHKALGEQGIRYELVTNPQPKGFVAVDGAQNYYVQKARPRSQEAEVRAKQLMQIRDRKLYPRPGAFEVRVRCGPGVTSELPSEFQVWSKLESRRWPDASRLARDIARLFDEDEPDKIQLMKAMQESCKPQGSEAAFSVGDQVEGLSQTNHSWYPCKIVKDHGNGSFDVIWDDGHTRDRTKTSAQLRKALHGSIRVPSKPPRAVYPPMFFSLRDRVPISMLNPVEVRPAANLNGSQNQRKPEGRVPTRPSSRPQSAGFGGPSQSRPKASSRPQSARPEALRSSTSESWMNAAQQSNSGSPSNSREAEREAEEQQRRAEDEYREAFATNQATDVFADVRDGRSPSAPSSPPRAAGGSAQGAPNQQTAEYENDAFEGDFEEDEPIDVTPLPPSSLQASSLFADVTEERAPLAPSSTPRTVGGLAQGSSARETVDYDDDAFEGDFEEDEPVDVTPLPPSSLQAPAPAPAPTPEPAAAPAPAPAQAETQRMDKVLSPSRTVHAEDEYEDEFEEEEIEIEAAVEERKKDRSGPQSRPTTAESARSVKQVDRELEVASEPAEEYECDFEEDGQEPELVERIEVDGTSYDYVEDNVYDSEFEGEG